jgi:hypothetical protein
MNVLKKLYLLNLYVVFSHSAYPIRNIRELSLDDASVPLIISAQDVELQEIRESTQAAMPIPEARTALVVIPDTQKMHAISETLSYCLNDYSNRPFNRIFF